MRPRSASSASCATTTCTRARSTACRPADRTLPGDFVAPRLGRAAPAAAGAGRRLVFFDGQLHLVDRDSGPLRADPARLMKVFWHCIASAASCRSISSGRSRTRSTSRTAPSSARRPCAICSGHLPDCGARRAADVPGDARARAARTVPAGVRRVTCLGSVRRLPQVLGVDQHSLLAVEHLEAPGARQSAESGRRRAGIERGGEARAPHARIAASTRRQGPRAWPRREGHSADPQLDHAIGYHPTNGALVEFLVRTNLTMSHIASGRHRRPQDHRGLRADRQRSAATQDALPAHLADMRAVGPASSPHGRPDPARALQAYACPAHRWSQRASEPDQLAERLRQAVGDELPRKRSRPSGDDCTDRYLATTACNGCPSTSRCSRRSATTSGRDRAVPSSRTGLVRSRRGHPRPARALPLIAGTLASQECNISAQIHTRATGSPSTPSRSTIQSATPSRRRRTGARLDPSGWC